MSLISSEQSPLSSVTPNLTSGNMLVFPTPIAEVMIPTSCVIVSPTATQPPSTNITEGSITWVTLFTPVW